MPKKSQRVNTHKPNGSMSESAEVLPPVPDVVLPSPEVAVEHIKKLGELNDRAIEAHKTYDVAAVRAKSLKGKAEECDEAVRNYIKEMTHPAHPTLFDVKQAEADTQVMESAALSPADPMQENKPGSESVF